MSDPVYIEMPKIICELLQRRMNLKANQVVIYNQKFNIPDTQGIFISVGFLAEKVYSSNLSYENSADQTELLEVQRLNKQETYSITVYSYNDEARQRKDEVVTALHSTLAQQMAERYAFKIGTLPSGFVDVSSNEGTKRLNRYNLTFNVLLASVRSCPVEYFDDFTAQGKLLTNP